MSFVKEVDGVKLSQLAISHTIGNCEHYDDAFMNTHTTLYQVIGFPNSKKFSKSILWMCFGLHKDGEVVIFDFQRYLERNINEALKIGKSSKFRWFLMLMHLITLL